MDEFSEALESAEWEGGERHVTIATGASPYPIICQLAKRAMEKFPLLRCDVIKIRNDFFGETITVTGLITAQDLIAQLKGRDNGEELLISSAMLRRDSTVFLDDLTVEDVERELNIKVRSSQSDGFELLDAIMGVQW